MPTGYTADIKKDITFKEFVLHCACSRFYDCSELPEEYEPSKYYTECIEKEEKELERLNSMTVKEAELCAEKDYNDMVKRDAQWKQNDVDLKKKYENMLKQVEAWKPPTEEHVPLKSFMVDQIQTSIEHDCFRADDPDYHSYDYKPRRNGKVWLRDKKLEVSKELARHKQDYKEELDRVNWKNNWIKLLRESLPEK